MCPLALFGALKEARIKLSITSMTGKGLAQTLGTFEGNT